MAGKVHHKAENYTIEWDASLGAIIHTWSGYTSGQQFRNGASDLLDAIRTHNAAKLIVDTSNIQAHDDKDKQWLQDEWMPKMIDAGVECSAQVHAESVISQMEMEKFDELNVDMPVDTLVTSDMSEARTWIAGR